MTDEKLCLKWNDFQDVFTASVGDMRNDTDFTDVTLACEDQSFKTHKVILSASSPFFKILLKSHPHPHPLLYLKGIKGSELVAVVDFIYHGEVKISQDQLKSFLALAEEFELNGLNGNSGEFASELSKYPFTMKDFSQNQTNVITELPKQEHFPIEEKRSESLTPTSEYQVPMQSNDPATIAKVESMIEKRGGGFSCTRCEYTTKNKSHMKDHNYRVHRRTCR